MNVCVCVSIQIHICLILMIMTLLKLLAVHTVFAIGISLCSWTTYFHNNEFVEPDYCLLFIFLSVVCWFILFSHGLCCLGLFKLKGRILNNKTQSINFFLRFSILYAEFPRQVSCNTHITMLPSLRLLLALPHTLTQGGTLLHPCNSHEAKVQSARMYYFPKLFFYH